MSATRYIIDIASASSAAGVSDGVDGMISPILSIIALTIISPIGFLPAANMLLAIQLGDSPLISGLSKFLIVGKKLSFVLSTKANRRVLD